MKIASQAVLAGVLLFGATSSVFAGGLLGIIGGKDSGALVTIGSGSASGSGLVNVGLGGGGGNLVDANVGGSGSNSVVKANVSSGGSSGSVLGANVGLLNNNVRVDASLGGGNLANVGVGIGGGGGGNGPGPGNGGGGNGGGGNGPGNGGNGPAVGGNGSASSSGSDSAPCVGTPVAQIDKLIRSTRVDASWQRASNVAIQQVAVCPDVKAWLANQVKGSNYGAQLQWALRNDVLASASLSRTSYGADRVFAVQRSGAQLTLFVY